MKELLLGSVIAAVALFFWGFVYWAVSPLPYTALKTVADETAAGQALLEHFPQSGTYYLPDPQNPDIDEMNALHRQGPVAMVDIDADGAVPQSPIVMLAGFAHMLITTLMISLLMRLTGDALATYGDRVLFVFLAGVIVAFWARISDVIWWGLGLPWQMYNAIYDVSAWLIAGLILAKFVGPKQTAVPQHGGE
ncbi:MAG: hypothetical protein O6838_01455 [Gammaproteobacteria bacterium]|nr:hypothetical protein [Gammaproteobacteria bacterium]